MAAEERRFDLPRNVERYLATLSKLYGRDGKRDLQTLLVNAQTRVHEEWTHDNWNGGTSGHALYLIVPEGLFLATIKDKDSIQKQICEDLNKIQNVQNEFFADVFIEMELSADSDWRSESGLLISAIRTVSHEDEKRIWDDDCFRLFLSHKSGFNQETADLKSRLRPYGISCFVAHQDIKPTKAWQDEIENALATMDGFAAVMTPDFHDSDWTDQEVGYALARGVPTMAIRFGKDPYGFMAKFQAIPGDWQTCTAEIAKIVVRTERGFDAYVAAIRKCPSWEAGNRLAVALPGLERLRSEQVDQLVAAYNETNELWGSWGFNGTRPFEYGPGIVAHLNRLSVRQFKFRAQDTGIEPV